MTSLKKTKLTTILNGTIATIAVAMVLYHLTSVHVVLQTPILHQNTHYGFGLMLVYLVALRTSKKWWPLTLLLILVSIGVTSYVHIFHSDLELRVGYPTGIDFIVGILLVLIGFEASRRAFGLILPLISLIFMLYAFLGHYLPQPLYHFYIPPERVVAHLSIGLSGIYGTPLGISANYIFLFLVFGGLLEATGANRFFLELGKLTGRRMRGGAGITAVVSSATVGMVSGSALANVGITGTFTIPTMKRVGYKPEVAAAIEAAASTGGQIMPPIMGASAFMMAGLLGVPYRDIMIMGFIPAALYFLTVGLNVQLYATKEKLRPDIQAVDLRELLLTSYLFIVPLSALTVLLVLGYSPMMAAFSAIMSVILLSYIRKETRLTLNKLINGFARGAMSGAQIAVICTCLGVLLTTMSLTGLGIRLPGMIEAISMGQLTVALIFTMIVSIILGMGVPTLAAYLLVAIAGAPALIRMGVAMAQAHFFAFYFAVFSCVTPPVAPAAIVASKIADSNYWGTAVHAVKMSFCAFIVPFLFIWNPALLGHPQSLSSAVLSIISTIMGLLASSVAIWGYTIAKPNIIERLMFAICGAVFFAYVISPNYVWITLGACLFVFLALGQWRKAKRVNSTEEVDSITQA